ncbi:hypothetical protein LOAG_15884, partial [Loa loa]
ITKPTTNIEVVEIWNLLRQACHHPIACKYFSASFQLLSQSCQKQLISIADGKLGLPE